MKEKPGQQVVLMVISMLVIIGIPKEPIMKVFQYLRFRGIGPEQLRTLVQYGTVELITVLVLLAAICVFLVSFFRLIRMGGKKKVPGLNQPRQKQGGSADSTLGQVSPGARDRYMTQLESYLQNGIVTKEEYQVLKERYEKRK